MPVLTVADWEQYMIHPHCSYEACKSCTHTGLNPPENVRVWTCGARIMHHDTSAACVAVLAISRRLSGVQLPGTHPSHAYGNAPRQGLTRLWKRFEYGLAWRADAHVLCCAVTKKSVVRDGPEGSAIRGCPSLWTSTSV